LFGDRCGAHEITSVTLGSHRVLWALALALGQPPRPAEPPRAARELRAVEPRTAEGRRGLS
ncbi:MAG TPA: hypothetical protein VMS00_03760, partial [Acidimicrobiales bacterium]|nr:hypothetical protein [Acidimicrobiales bacterium]